ncbi:GNAT family N-acetyltransferase [Sphingomonas sp. 37zxx]|uniref:GNAT family N-acetyltransferase n=1 Tax=Sphingomonas sp. 37zxx TaxID=1550073 RepID=UPI00053BEC6B|nr:GNAT family N-acetyltransferase [Sphingomonas sp. 37zxx]
MESPPAIALRRFAPDDLGTALAIQSAAYPAFLVEPADAFASRLMLAASYCLVAARDGVVIAYLLAHGWPRESPAAIGAVLTDGASEVLFLHDLAVAKAGRGTGIGRKLVVQALALAAEDGLAAAELIAVAGAAGYWRALGFCESAVSAALAAKVAGYGPEARWMTRAL